MLHAVKSGISLTIFKQERCSRNFRSGGRYLKRQKDAGMTSTGRFAFLSVTVSKMHRSDKTNSELLIIEG